MELFRDLVSDDFVGIRGGKGAPAFEEPVAQLFKAFPDIQWKIEEMMGEEDTVFVRWFWHGTQTGQFANFEATGNTVSIEGMAVYVLKDGKIINGRVLTDRLGFWQGLGVLPADIISASGKANVTKVGE